MTSEDEYAVQSSSGDEEDNTTGRILRRRKSTGLYALPTRRSARKPRKTLQKQQGVSAKLPATLEEVHDYLATIDKHLHGVDYDVYSTARVIKAALVLQKDYLEEKKKRGQEKGKTLTCPKVRETISRLFGVSSVTYSRILTQFFNNKSLYSRERKGNTTSKQCQIPNTRAIVHMIRDFVREERRHRRRV